MVMQFHSADDAGCMRFFEASAECAKFMDGFDQSSCSQSCALSQDAGPSWMPTHDGSADWADTWSDLQLWQNAGLALDCSMTPPSSWGAYQEQQCQQQQQQQQWAAALLSSPRSWACMDPSAMPLASEVLEKPAKAALPTSIQWTEMALDPEKPATPASKSRPVSSNLGGSGSKLPPPVGSGRQRHGSKEVSDMPKKLPFGAGEGCGRESAATLSALGQLLEASPASLSLALGGGMLKGMPSSATALLQPPAVAITAASTPSSHSSRTDLLSNFGGSRSQSKTMPTTAGPQDVTTVMVRNVPSSVKQSAFVKELEDTGFGGSFDFCYLPSAFNTGKNKGYAFVNFVSISAYSAFVKAWHGSRRFNARAAEPALNVSAAALQGLDRNIDKWDAPRMRRVRNPEYRPFVVKGGRMESGALATPSDDEAATCWEYGQAMELLPGLLGPPPPGLAVATAQMPAPPGLALLSGLAH